MERNRSSGVLVTFVRKTAPTGTVDVVPQHFSIRFRIRKLSTKASYTPSVTFSSLEANTMNIKSAVGDLAKPQLYAPTLAGGVVGVFGSVWAVKAIKDVVGSVDPIYDWVIKGGWTVAMIMGMLAVKPGTAVNTAIHTALLTGAVSGAVMLISKQFPTEIGPYTSLQGRAGPVARGGVRVIGRGPGYPANTPTYAQATPVAVKPTPSDVIQAF